LHDSSLFELVIRSLTGLQETRSPFKQNLPIEILTAIGDHVGESQLLHIVQVNRHLYDVFIPRLYEDFSQEIQAVSVLPSDQYTNRHTRRLSRFLDPIFTTPRLACLVKSLDLVDCWKRLLLEHIQGSELEGGPITSVLGTLSEYWADIIITRLPQIELLELDIDPGDVVSQLVRCSKLSNIYFNLTDENFLETPCEPLQHV
jgi:hypothetical protein